MRGIGFTRDDPDIVSMSDMECGNCKFWRNREFARNNWGYCAIGTTNVRTEAGLMRRIITNKADACDKFKANPTERRI